MRKEKVEIRDYRAPLQYGPAFKLDEYDKRLLHELDQNARSSLIELSKKVGLSPDAIRNRIQKMVENKVILAFTPIYNPPALGYPTINYVFISLYNPNEKQEKELIAFLQSHKNITYIASLIGKWDFILDIMAQNPGEFDKILKEIRQKFPDLIKDYEVYGVLQEYKYEEIGKLVHD